MKRDKWATKESEKICAIDIDGVLSDYPACWIKFANSILKTNFKTLFELKEKLSYSQYKKLKHLYRKSGYKADLPVKDGAVELTQKLRAKGYKIVIITARPFSEYPEMFKHTRHWLNINEFDYDYLIEGGKTKHLKVLSEFPHIKFFIEDNSYVANLLAKWGYTVYLIDNEYNKDITLPKVIRTKSIKALAKII